MKNFYFLTFIFISIFAVSVQEKTAIDKRFDSIFYDTAVRLTPVNVKKAEQVADSLYKTSKKDIHKVKSLMLLADILEKQVKREEAIKYTLQAEELANSIENYKWLARIYGFLATQYRIVGLIDLGKEYLDKGVENAKKIKDKGASELCLGMVFQEKAHYAINDKNYKESIQLLKQADKLFEAQENTNNKSLFIGMNGVMIGRSFLDLKKHDSAWYHFNRSLKYFEKIGIKDSQWMGEIYQGKGEVLLEKKDYKQAEAFLMKSLEIAKSTNYKALLEIVYKDLSKLYKDTGDTNNYNIYNKKYLEETEKIIKGDKIAVNSIVNRIFKNHETRFSNLNIIIIGITFLFFLSMVFFYRTKRKQKRDYKQFVEKISKLENKTQSLSKHTVIDADKIEPLSIMANRPERVMPEETENLILEKLREFENQDGFIDSNITLPKLSADIGVNTKYLSHVINKHKKKDFNNYINELRIFYIAKKLQNNPEYLNYKISYLSSECGFSSHSKFSAVFKKETGLTPSSFMNQVSKERASMQENVMT